MGAIAHESDVAERPAWRFGAVARTTKGGVVVPLERSLFHFDNAGASTAISTVPSVDELAEQTGATDMLEVVSAAVGPTGSIYLLMGNSIYRALPWQP